MNVSFHVIKQCVRKFTRSRARVPAKQRAGGIYASVPTRGDCTDAACGARRSPFRRVRIADWKAGTIADWKAGTIIERHNPARPGGPDGQRAAMAPRME